MKIDKTPGTHSHRFAHFLRRGGLWSTATALAACTTSPDHSAPPASGESVGTVREAVSGGFPDTDSPATNVVVAVNSNCTGTLITPQIVLTANHCIYGDTAQQNCTPKTLGSVHIGPDGLANAVVSSGSQPLWRQLTIADAATVAGTCQPTGDGSNDLAVLYLTAPATFASLLNATNSLVPRVVRPRLTSPNDPSFAVAGAQFGVAGFTLFEPRRQYLLLSDPSALSYGPGNDGYRWHTGTGSWTTEPGDSGGPVFYEYPDGHLEVLGALRGAGSGEMAWSAITDGTNRDWLIAHVKESNVPVALRHSANWLATHNHTAETWWGEIDYSGPCDTNVDRDCDGWWDRNVPAGSNHDNCIYIANPDQADNNNDGVGDACQLCPFDPAGNDPDGDGVCTGTPLGGGLRSQDNCPAVQNANQANCNEEAERVKQRSAPSFEILGDACDPVPCPQTRALATGQYKNPVGGGHPEFGGFYSGRVITDAIEALRVAPHMKQPPTSTPVSRPLSDVVTSGRFCQDNKSAGYDCHADRNIRDSALDDFSSSTTEFASSAKPWHRVLLSLNSTNRDLGWHWPYNDTLAANHAWLYGQDWSFWSAGAKIPPAQSSYVNICGNTSLVGSGTCLDGALWYHGTTTVGRTANPYSQGLYVGVHDGDIANHYFDIKPDRAYTTTYSGTGLQRAFFFLVDTLPDPAPYESVLRARIRPLVAATASDAPRVVEDHGGSWDARAIISANLATELATAGTVWTSAVGPSGVATNLDRRVQAMAISADGTLVKDTILYDQGTLKSAADLGYSSSSVAATNAPPARTGFLSVLSRSVGGVFVIGGLGVDANQELADIHLWRPGVGWSTIIPTIQFASARSATFSPADGNLWILEERRDSYTLLRISPWTGIAQSLGNWAHGTIWDQHFLTVDRDGQVLLVASSRQNRQTMFGRLRVDSGGLYASQIDADSIPYTTSAPIVDKDEYGVIVRDDTGAVTSVFRRANLFGGTGRYPLTSFF